MQKFYVDECPDSMTVADWIKKQIPWNEAKDDVKASSKLAKYKNFVYEFKGSVKGLQDSLQQALDEYGYYGWKSSAGDENVYGGYSITYNPSLQYKDQPIHQHTLGTKLNDPDDFYTGKAKGHSFIKNSYLDGLSFNELTPAAQMGYLGELLKEIGNSLTITRSRMGIINGQILSGSVRFHKDAEIFELTRLNIPVTGDDSYIFEFYEGEPYVLELGRAYTWNTEYPHRVMCVRHSSIDRANLVLGLSPWLAYNKEERYWYTNQFFGKKHPFDIFVEGHVTDKIKLIGYA